MPLYREIFRSILTPVKYTVNCTTFDIQKCTTLKNKRKTGFSLTKLDQNVQSGYVLYSKNPT